jgi:CHAT domain-containing protein
MHFTSLPFLVVFTFMAGAVHAQVEMDRYNRLLMAIATAPDKLTVAHELVTETEKSYKPDEIQYFNGYLTAGMQVTMTNPKFGITCLEKAITAFHENERAYKAILFDDSGILQAYTSLISAYNALGLRSSSVGILESRKSFFDQGTNNAKAAYYNLLGDQYASAGEKSRARQCYNQAGNILASGEPMIVINKKDPKWKKDMMANLEKVYRDSRQMLLNSSLGEYYYDARRYDSAVLYMKAENENLQALNNFTQEATKVSRFATMLLADTMKTMVKENKDYQSISAELSGANTRLIIALFKSGQKEAAREASRGLLDRAYFYHLNNELEQAAAAYQEALAKAKEFSEWRYYKWASAYFTGFLSPQYSYLQCTRKNFAEALASVQQEISESDRSFERDFPYFSENEKREYFQNYGAKLQRYYSILLSMGESDATKLWEVLNKSIQVKGIILEATKEQQKRFRSVTDPAVIAQMQQIISHREKLNAFTQLATHGAFPADDSIRHYTLAINNLQKIVNEKAGVGPTLLRSYTWKDLQGKLKPTEAYVEIIPVDRDQFNFDAPVREYWAFVLHANGNPVAKLIGNGPAFDRQLKSYQNNIRFQQDDTATFTTCWDGIARSLQGIKKVYFNGDGVFHTLNPLTFKNPGTNQFVMDEITLVRVSTGRDLLKKTPTKSEGEAVLIGNPDFTMDRKSSMTKVQARPLDLGMISTLRSGFSTLPGTQREVTAISSFATAVGSKVTLLTGHQASEVNVKKVARPALLHFATHGAFRNYDNGDSYLKSMLILAGAGDEKAFALEDYAHYEDGYLTAYEVTQMDLAETNLVVLSACETGLGDVQAGEGVWGLQRAFQVAGAQAIIGSLWKISDEATAVFMEAFYNSYLKGVTTGYAYRHAIAETRKTYPHPYFWGAFVLTE